MTTAISFQTNSIDAIATLNIGTTTATSVSLDTTTTQDLTVIGITTSEIITPTIQPSYVSYPTEQSSQRAIQLFNVVQNFSVNNPLNSLGVITTVFQLNAGPTLLTISLPIGVRAYSTI